MFFSNCVEVSAQEAAYLDLQIPLTKCTRDIVFVNTSVPEERIFLLKPKDALDELPDESTDAESDNVIQAAIVSVRGGHLGHLTSIMSSDFHFLVPESFHTKFGLDRYSSF